MATKLHTKFFCDACGCESIKWMGRCPGCGAYDSMVEAPTDPEESDDARGIALRPAVLKRLSEIQSTETQRIPSGVGEADRVLGGGIVP